MKRLIARTSAVTNEDIEAVARAIATVLVKQDDEGTIFDYVPYILAAKSAIEMYRSQLVEKNLLIVRRFQSFPVPEYD